MSFVSACEFLFYHLHYYGGCLYVKGTKQILLAVCVVEFSGLHMKSSFPKRYKSILIVFMKMTFFYLDPYILLIFNLSC